MGVNKLHFFVSKLPKGEIDINICDEIEKWKREHPNEQPILVFDVMGCISLCIKDYRETLCGGRHQIYLRQYSKFFKTLIQQHNAKLIFFCDGVVQDIKLKESIERQYHKYQKQQKFLDGISDGKSLYNIKNRPNQLPPRITTTIDGMLHLAKQYGELYFSLDRECDLDIAEYATKNNAVAIFANDSDFYIYSGNWQYWSAGSTNLLTMRTRRNNRTLLRQTLKLSDEQLPLFATLCGNDIVNVVDVKEFHMKLTKNDIDNRNYNNNNDNTFGILYQIADYINKNFQKNSFNLTNRELEFIARNILKSPGLLDGKIQNIKDSINLYNLELNATKFSESPLHNVDGIIQSIIARKPYMLSNPSYMDMTKTDMMPYHEIILPLLERQYGILLQYNKDVSLKPTVYVKFNADEYHRPIKISPIYTKFAQPSLLDLLLKRDDNLSEARFKLLAWMISEKLKPKILQTFSENYLIHALVIFLLTEKKSIEIYEADAILLIIDDIIKGKLNERIYYPDRLHERSVRICSLYCNVHHHILRSIEICGLQKYMVPLNLDGVHFHRLVEELRRLHEYSLIEYQQKVKCIEKFKLHVEEC